MKNYQIERNKWRKEAHKFAKKRWPRGCCCSVDSGTPDIEPCGYCAEVERYMAVMEAHADVLLSDAKVCPF